jgi:hypothetical protein
MSKLNSYLTVNIPPSATKASLLMLCTDINAVCCQNHTQHICIFYIVRANWRGKDKGKVQPRTRHEGPDGALEVGGWLKPRPGRFNPRKDPVPIVQEAEWALRSLWTGSENLAPLRFDPWTAQPVASYNTDYAIPETAEVFDVKESGTNNYHCSLNG